MPSAALELSPDVILLDYAMLDIDGAEISRWLRADPTTAAIPIILMSTHPPAARPRMPVDAELPKLAMAQEGVHPLHPDVVAALLHAVAEEIQAEVAALPPDVAGWHPAPDEWCVKETLGHLVETEHRGFAGRIGILLQSAEPHLLTWDPMAVARAA